MFVLRCRIAIAMTRAMTATTTAAITIHAQVAIGSSCELGAVLVPAALRHQTETNGRMARCLERRQATIHLPSAIGRAAQVGRRTGMDRSSSTAAFAGAPGRSYRLLLSLQDLGTSGSRALLVPCRPVCPVRGVGNRPCSGRCG